MSFPFNFVPPQFPPFFGNNSANYPPQNDFSFFENPFMGQPFFNNFGNPNPPSQPPQFNNEFNPFQQNVYNQNTQNFYNPTFVNSPRKTSKKEKPEPNLKMNPSDLLKEKGNEFFKAGNYKEAIRYYSDAIKKDPNQSTYYLNRALCFKYLGLYQDTLRDCGIAIELDDKNYKAYLLMGRTMAEMSKYENNTKNIDKALLKIEKAIKLYQQDPNKSSKIMKEMKTYYRRAEKLLWYKGKELTKTQNCDIYSYIQNALKYDTKISEKQKKDTMTALESVVANPYKNEENNYIVPDEFCCKITLEIMDEPYLCPSGISYEKNVLYEHLSNHDFDPVTREKLTTNQIFPNMTLKIAIENYLSKNPWAFEFVTGENYLNIEF